MPTFCDVRLAASYRWALKGVVAPEICMSPMWSVRELVSATQFSPSKLKRRVARKMFKLPDMVQMITYFTMQAKYRRNVEIPVRNSTSGMLIFHFHFGAHTWKKEHGLSIGIKENVQFQWMIWGRLKWELNEYSIQYVRLRSDHHFRRNLLKQNKLKGKGRWRRVLQENKHDRSISWSYCDGTQHLTPILFI